MPKKRAPKRLVNELNAVVDKHKWDGFAAAATPASGQGGNCPPGTTPHDITYQQPDGTWVTKTVCL